MEEKELGSQLSPSSASPTEAGPSWGEMSSERWLHSCCFCLGLKIAFSLPMSSSGPGRAVEETHKWGA